MNHESYSDAYIRSILSSVKTIAMVGASANSARPSYLVLKYLSERGYRMLPVNPGLAGGAIHGLPVYASLRGSAGSDRHGRNLPQFRGRGRRSSTRRLRSIPCRR